MNPNDLDDRLEELGGLLDPTKQIEVHFDDRPFEVYLVVAADADQISGRLILTVKSAAT